ncbi:hypothetical protein E2C01_021689 [Portunus trituberculatus]|uniref:Uncharacterized protein n=1 Tax=Portunus trituberculatus TaxID=210409 RepID=A0A5B7E5D5_PORTR|nr:hypothetical protein [Portunus trituberculatus]
MAGTNNPRRAALSLSFLRGTGHSTLNRDRCHRGVYQPTTTPIVEEQSARLLPTPDRKLSKGNKNENKDPLDCQFP